MAKDVKDLKKEFPEFFKNQTYSVALILGMTFIVILFVGLILLVPYILQLIWNETLVSVAPFLRPITYWQMWALWVFNGLFFGLFAGLVRK